MASRIEQLTARMVDMSTVQQDLLALIYGESGVGKTVLAAQLAQAVTPEGLGILFLDTRQGFAAIRNHEGLDDRMQRIPIKEADDITTVAQAIMNKTDWFAYIGTVIVDEVNVLASDNLASVLRKRLGVPADEVVRAVPEWPDYNANQAEIGSALSALSNIDGLSVIQVSHIRYNKDDRGVSVSTPDFSPGLSQIIRRDMHLIGLLTAKLDRNSADEAPTYSREVQVQPSARIVAKTRIGGLPVKVHPDTLISEVAIWLDNPRQMKQDLAAPESVEVAEDEVSTDGVLPGDTDDEPIFLGDDN